jgi:hypothetical protein
MQKMAWCWCFFSLFLLSLSFFFFFYQIFSNCHVSLDDKRSLKRPRTTPTVIDLNPAVQDCTTSKNFITLYHLKRSGLNRNDDQHLFFVREEWTKLWNSALSGMTDNLVISGPPGCGKSSLVWAWCLFYGKDHIVQWIHIDRTQVLDIVLIEKGKISSEQNEWSNDLIKRDADLIVVDGITKDYIIPLRDVKMWYSQTSHRFIVVTSLQLKLFIEDYKNWKMQSVLCSGWTWEEYVAACQDQSQSLTPFANSINGMLDTSDLTTTDFMERLEEKYFIAGACARWMFFANTQDVREEIQNQISRVQSSSELLAGLEGNRSNAVVNHLITNICRKTGLVSQYVARELAKKSFLDFIKQATIQSRSIGVSALDGWLFQLDFLFHLRKAPIESKMIKLEGSEIWKVTSIIEFYKEEELITQVSQFQDDCWFIPTKVNQGAYDVAQVSNNLSTLRVVQLTVANTHDLKLRFVIKLIETLEKAKVKISKLEVVVVVPAGKVNDYKMGKIESDKATTIKNLKWKKNQIQIKAFPRSS